jgi:hypothetical protein
VKLIFGAALGLLAATLAGCSDPPPAASVVVVVMSDLDIPRDVDALQLSAVAGPSAPNPGMVDGLFHSARLLAFPTGVKVFEGGMAPNFSITVQLLDGLFNPANTPPTIAVARTVSDIRFTDQRTMMLVLPMWRACSCQGTTCPSPGNPDCDNIQQPTLQPFDPAVATPIEPALSVSQPTTGRH